MCMAGKGRAGQGRAGQGLLPQSWMGTSPEIERWRREVRRKREDCILATGHWASDWTDKERGYTVVGCVSVQASRQCALLSVECYYTVCIVSMQCVLCVA